MDEFCIPCARAFFSFAEQAAGVDLLGVSVMAQYGCGRRASDDKYCALVFSESIAPQMVVVYSISGDCGRRSGNPLNPDATSPVCTAQCGNYVEQWAETAGCCWDTSLAMWENYLTSRVTPDPVSLAAQIERACELPSEIFEGLCVADVQAQVTLTLGNVKPSYMDDPTKRAIVGRHICADLMNQIGGPRHACRLTDYRSNSAGVQVVLQLRMENTPATEAAAAQVAEDAADGTLYMPTTEQYLIENRADALLSTTNGVTFSATSDGTSTATDDDEAGGDGAARASGTIGAAMVLLAVAGTVAAARA